MIPLSAIAEHVDGRLEGDGTCLIKGFSSILDAKEGEITILLQPSYRRHLVSSRASAVLVPQDLQLQESEAGRKAILRVKNPAQAYVRLAQLFEKRKKKGGGVSSLAFVGPDAEIAESASIGPFAHIGSGSTIAPGVTIHPYAYIGDNVTIGDDSVLYPHVTVYDNTTIGKRVVIHGGSVIGSDGFGYLWDGEKHAKIPQIGSVELEDDVEIGANTTIDRASLGKTVIGRGSKIDNLVQIAHNVSVGEHSIIVAQVGVAGSTTIGRNVILAGQVGVKDHVKIGNNVRAAGQTGITKDVPDNAVIGGTPHMAHMEWARLQAHLKRLPDLIEKVKQLEEKLKQEADKHG